MKVGKTNCSEKIYDIIVERLDGPTPQNGFQKFYESIDLYSSIFSVNL